MSGGARRHAACNGSAVNNNDRAAELAQLISGREPRNSAAVHRDLLVIDMLLSTGENGSASRRFPSAQLL